MSHPIKSPRKLIEVALPLDSINVACAKEKSIRHGHPSTLHLWWARRPLAAARAVIFAQLVNDPGYQQGGGFKYGKNKKEAAIERKRLFKIIEDLVLWENTTNEEVLDRARAEIRRSWREVCDLNKDHPQAIELFNPEKLPALHDPFAGGGAIPLEAQRLGLEAHASDLNPLAVLINKAMIEIPPKFAGWAPVNPEWKSKSSHEKAANPWAGAQGLADDVRYYGQLLRDEAEKRIGHLYPKAEITVEMTKERPDLKRYEGQKLTVIGWLWARTVKSPNPAFAHVDVPLASNFMLATKAAKEAYVEPVVEGGSYRFTVKLGTSAAAKTGTKLSRGANFQCVMSGTPIAPDYIKAEGMAGRIGARLMAIVAEGDRGRIYISPSVEHERIAASAKPEWVPDQEIAYDPHSGATYCVLYGLTKFGDLFTRRQLLALSVFCDLVKEARERVMRDYVTADPHQDERALTLGGTGAAAYADAISMYLGLGISRLTNRSATLNFWDTKGENIQQVFARQALPMTWDFVEGNPFSESTGNFLGQLGYLTNALLSLPRAGLGFAMQQDAATQSVSSSKIVSTDPPYFDNVPYADISDFFYVWLRRSLKPIFPELFATLAAPKKEELVAFAYRHKDKAAAEVFFLDGMTQAMHRLAEQAHPAFPVTIYYAFRQAETDSEGTASTGWETFLDAVIRAGFGITGTWPMRTEYTGNLKNKQNALASSIVLVCGQRPSDAASISRREFLRELNTVLPDALDVMTKGSAEDRSPVAAVDLSQAIIGPGMAVFSKYAAVVEANGESMSVRTALQLINRFLGEDDFDHDTRFCLHWFEQNGWSGGAFGDAETLSRAKGTSVTGVEQAGVIESGGSKVRLLKWSEYAPNWDPKTDTRNPVWETLHHLIRALKQEGDAGAGRLLSAVRGQGESARQLAYRLYTLCERQGWAEDARSYNELITSWTGIESASGAVPTEKQGNLFEGAN